MLFAALNLERDPLKLADVPAGMLIWVQTVGGFAAFGLLIWLIYRVLSPRSSRALAGALAGSYAAAAMSRVMTPESQRGGGYFSPGGNDDGQTPGWASSLFTYCVFGSALGFLVVGILRLPFVLNFLSETFGGEGTKPGEKISPLGGERLFALCLTFAAGCALTAVLIPFLANVSRLRFRRIGAIARLSAKEAIRGRVLYVFSALVLVALFSTWFVRSKSEAQLNTYVKIAFTALTPLLLMSAGLLAAFSIPNDLKRQTIHTVVTKPIERFEIVLGRFLGYVMLMTVVLFVLTTLSLFYVLRGVNADAAHESLKARVPLYGELDFQKTEGEYTDNERTGRTKPENVGREWGYHQYIPGNSPDKTDVPVSYAVWVFNDLPRSLVKRDRVRCEFKFDIYRTTKGRENAGVQCSFFFQTRYYNKTRATRKAYQEARGGGSVGFSRELDNKLSRDYGYYEVQGKTIADYHTMHVDIPAGLIDNALNGPPGGGEAREGAPLLMVRVRCDTPTQFVGMARYDLYLREDDAEGGSNAWAFALNFYKASLGLWMRLCLVVGLAVCLSTVLGGIISFLCAMLLFLGGMCHEFIRAVAEGKTPGGGSVEAGLRLFTRKHLLVPLEDTTGAKVIKAADAGSRWLIHRVLNVLPDVDRFSFTDRVANGFDIGVIGQDLLPTLLLMIGYLFPWVVLGFYLMKSREIAGAN